MTKLKNIEAIKTQYYSELKFMGLSSYKQHPEEYCANMDLYDFDDVKLNEFTDNELFLLRGMCQAIHNIYSAIDCVETQTLNARERADRAYAKAERAQQSANHAENTAQCAAGRTS